MIDRLKIRFVVIALLLLLMGVLARFTMPYGEALWWMGAGCAMLIALVGATLDFWFRDHRKEHREVRRR